GRGAQHELRKLHSSAQGRPDGHPQRVSSRWGDRPLTAPHATSMSSLAGPLKEPAVASDRPAGRRTGWLQLLRARRMMTPAARHHGRTRSPVGVYDRRKELAALRRCDWSGGSEGQGWHSVWSALRAQQLGGCHLLQKQLLDELHFGPLQVRHAARCRKVLAADRDVNVRGEGVRLGAPGEGGCADGLDRMQNRLLPQGLLRVLEWLVGPHESHTPEASEEDRDDRLPDA